MTELRGLTGLRGVAAWLVVLYHIRLSIAGLPPGIERVLAKGYLAVDFFFLLSGFVIWLAWHERFRRDGLAAVRPFLVKRLARVWPLHALILGGAALLAAAMAATGHGDPARFPPAEFPLHLLLIQNWGFTDRLTWNDPAWSISVEAAAYLLFPLLAIAIDWKRVPGWVMAMAMAALFGTLHVTMTRSGATTLGYEIARFGLLRCLVEFAAGTMVGALWVRASGRTGVVALGVGVALLTLTAAGVLPETLAVPTAFAALLLGLAIHDQANPLGHAVPHALGEASYATYLGHFLLFFVFKLVLVDNPRAIPPGLIALYLTLVLAMSFALYRGFERPAQRWMQRMLSGHPRLPSSLSVIPATAGIHKSCCLDDLPSAGHMDPRLRGDDGVG